ncbi:hypothetical protein BC833DRAFT_656710 [Globomyces pollinis-pini]|nr:hypothetical protein BC833DRAFT_656710 [Globomyces pollinis-pini]
MTEGIPDITKTLLKNLLYKSLDFQLDGKFKTTSKVFHTILKSLTEEVQLELYSNEEENGLLLTICGTLYVMDVEMHQSDGSILKVKLSGSDMNEIDERAHLYLTNLFQNHDIKAFRNVLQFIAFLDKSQTHPDLDLFHCLSALQQDLSMIHQIERSNGNSLQSVICCGHGYTNIYKRNLGPCITFWAPPQVFSELEKNENDSTILDDIMNHSESFNAEISIESSNLNVFLPKSRSQSCFQTPPILNAMEQPLCVLSQYQVLGGSIGILLPTPSSPIIAPVALKMVLEPSICVTRDVAQLLGYQNLSLDDSNTFEKVWKDRISKKHVSENPKYKCTFAVTLDTPSVYLEKVLFSNLSQVMLILNTLRQAVVFNQLIQTFFFSTQTSTDNPIFVHLVGWVPCTSLQLLLLHKRNPYRYQIDITINSVGSISVNVITCDGSGTSLNFNTPALITAIADLNTTKILDAVIQTLDNK